MNETDMTN